ncbi:uncharacterized protein EV422DRAFT_37478 [Fimicolochytrium jonesii]|uniref:uncharacterized protein n=1 Tax=Fimicolochytrium jonesii TaxID=1396493 RepID=UPI0022FE8B08|nr:uncharacterized protein EV422DRAFT_37478 [Fimicolochytrium jonesii]KAI8821313.1 hypothetical protein EV422DRAFT_37478 [Fimicolochytrium jonesii]
MTMPVQSRAESRASDRLRELERERIVADEVSRNRTRTVSRSSNAAAVEAGERYPGITIAGHRFGGESPASSVTAREREREYRAAAAPVATTATAVERERGGEYCALTAPATTATTYPATTAVPAPASYTAPPHGYDYRYDPNSTSIAPVPTYSAPPPPAPLYTAPPPHTSPARTLQSYVRPAGLPSGATLPARDQIIFNTPTTLPPSRVFSPVYGYGPGTMHDYRRVVTDLVPVDGDEEGRDYHLRKGGMVGRGEKVVGRYDQGVDREAAGVRYGFRDNGSPARSYVNTPAQSTIRESNNSSPRRSRASSPVRATTSTGNSRPISPARTSTAWTSTNPPQPSTHPTSTNISRATSPTRPAVHFEPEKVRTAGTSPTPPTTHLLGISTLPSPPNTPHTATTATTAFPPYSAPPYAYRPLHTYPTATTYDPHTHSTLTLKDYTRPASYKSYGGGDPTRASAYQTEYDRQFVDWTAPVGEVVAAGMPSKRGGGISAGSANATVIGDARDYSSERGGEYPRDVGTPVGRDYADRYARTIPRVGVRGGVADTGVYADERVGGSTGRYY